MPDAPVGGKSTVTSVRARTAPTQIRLVAWLVGSCIVWLSNAYLSVETVRRAREFPDTCAGLTAFEQLGADLVSEDRIIFIRAINDWESGRNFYCAQYDLAPRVLGLEPPSAFEAFATPGTAFLVYFTRDESPEATSKRIADLAASRQSRLDWRRLTDSIFLARLVRH